MGPTNFPGQRFYNQTHARFSMVRNFVTQPIAGNRPRFHMSPGGPLAEDDFRSVQEKTH